MNSKKKNYYRLILQWTVLLLLAYLVLRPLIDEGYVSDFEAYCPFGGLQALSSYLVSDTLACSMTSLQICIGIALIIAVIVFSKLFCSYVCPVGTFTEWIGRIGEKLKIRYTLKGIADRIFRIFKYALLFLTFYFTIGSSELFCKKYDPYYAVFSGFSTDVVVLYAVISIVIVVLGSLFLRQFWCKYLCPLSAATNIFSNFILFAVLTCIYIILVAGFNLKINWVWFLGVTVFLAFLKEVLMLRTKVFPLFKVTRNPDTCTLCRKCDKACPMAIKVSESGAVNHIDCHMCGDCIVKCPEKDVLKINRRRLRWLPPLAVVVLTAAAVLFASYTEIPTISEKWGTKEQMENAKVLTMSGLKNIKCYGSSISFAEQMKDVEGILGVETFVGSYSVKIFYDPAVISEEQVKAAVFTPSKSVLNDPDCNSEIGYVILHVSNYFDAYDEYYFTQLLLANKDIYGFTSSFGEPVKINVFFNSAKLGSKKIIEIIESPEIVIKDGEQETSTPLSFKVSDCTIPDTVISCSGFYNLMFPPVDDTFNNFGSYAPDALSVIEIPVLDFGKEAGENLPYLESHLSGDDAVVGMKSFFRNDTAFLKLIYVKTKTDSAKIFERMNSKILTIYYGDGTTEEIENVFNFNRE